MGENYNWKNFPVPIIVVDFTIIFFPKFYFKEYGTEWNDIASWKRFGKNIKFGSGSARSEVRDIDTFAFPAMDLIDQWPGINEAFQSFVDRAQLWN